MSDLYVNLSSESDSTLLDPAPVEMWSIVSFEFPIIFSGKKFLLLTQPYYGGGGSGVSNLGEGILYPPFNAASAEVGFFKARTLGAARQRTYTVAEPMLNEKAFQQIAYNLGLGEPDFEILSPLDELKISPRDHNIHKFFRLFRVRAWNRTTKGRRNIVDPEFLKGHFIVPIDIATTLDVSNEVKGPHQYRFKSKVLCSHFPNICQYYQRDVQNDKYTHITEMDLLNKETGFILSFDISGFGSLNYDVRSKLSNPMQSGDAVAERFRAKIIELFEEFCINIGSSQIRFMGDGFICGCPFRYFGNDEKLFVSRLRHAWELLIADIEKMNSFLPLGLDRLGSRLVVVVGEYSFGKVGGLSASVADFDGNLLIKAARSEQILSQFTRENQLRNKHIIATEQEMSASLADAFRSVGFMPMQSTSGAAKEATVDLQIYC